MSDIGWVKKRDLIEWDHFDFGDNTQTGRFRQSISGLPNGEVVFLTMADYFCPHPGVEELVRSVGGTAPFPKEGRPTAYICLGIKGLPPGCAIESYDNEKPLHFPLYRQEEIPAK